MSVAVACAEEHHQVQHACCLMALLCPWVCVASKTPMPTATHSWARDGQRRQTSVQQVCNKCATSVQQVWYLLRGVIELARAPGHAPKHMQRNLRASTRTAFRRVSADAREQGRCRQPSNSLPTNPKGLYHWSGACARYAGRPDPHGCGARAHTRKHPCTEMPAVGSHATCAAALL
jgi:hypothetical protein